MWEVLRDGGGERGERQRIAARLRLRSDDGEPGQKPAALRGAGLGLWGGPVVAKGYDRRTEDPRSQVGSCWR